MNKELIINAAPQAVEIALLEDKKLVEMHNENANASFGVGDLYLGKVKKLIPGLNAAFIDVGFEKDAFLWRPAPKMYTIGHAVGETVAWPQDAVLVLDEEFSPNDIPSNVRFSLLISF